MLCCLTILCCFIAVKLIGKLQDGTVFLKKGYEEDEEPFEFKTDEGINIYGSWNLVSFLHFRCHEDDVNEKEYWCFVQNK